MKNIILCVLGAGRSGTTLLDIILGNGNGITSCGELMRFVETRGEPPGYGPETGNYKYWQGISESLVAKYQGNFDYAGMLDVCKRVEYHRWFPRTYVGLVPEELVNSYITYNRRLYESIFETIDTHIIVDSSKWPGRAAAMYHYMEEFEFRFIYLIRNPVHVVRSFAKRGLEQGPKNFGSANVYYFMVNMACSRLIKKFRGARVSVIRYEDLLRDPERQLRRLQQQLDINLLPCIDRLSGGQALEIGNLFEGNRIRMQDTLTLRTDIREPDISGRDRITLFLNSHWWKKYAHSPD